MNTKFWAMLIVICFGFVSSAKANELAIGKSAKKPGAIDISIISPAEFNFKSKDEIYRIRKQEVLKHPELITGTYAPSDEVFGQIVDRKPWWGLVGQAYFGSGQNSIRGASEESRFILNPFLLVGDAGIRLLKKSRISESDLATHTYPMFYCPTGLHWWPKEGKAEVTYEISAYKREMCSLLGYSSWTVTPELYLEAINARDLGLKYFYIPPSWAYNVKFGSPMHDPMLIPHFIHCGGSCGYPGGCNNMSPHCDELDNCTFTNLPARLCFMFWKSSPSTGKEKPDMIYTMNYR